MSGSMPDTIADLRSHLRKWNINYAKKNSPYLVILFRCYSKALQRFQFGNIGLRFGQDYFEAGLAKSPVV